MTTENEETRVGGQAADRRETYSVAEAAVLLGLCPTTTYKLIREGEVPARRMGGRWIVPKRRFHAWLDARPDEHEGIAL